jgi:hypothetical protein
MISMPNTSYQKSNFRQGIKIASDYDLSPQYAVNARRRYLTDELELLDLEIAFYNDYEGELDSEYFAITQMSLLGEDRAKTMRELRSIKNMSTTKPGLTDDMIDEAMRYPVDKLIEFTRGKAVAFCHQDKNPSMYHGTRLNIAVCPVCDKKFNPIKILMERDGIDFKSAVKQLT